MGKTINLLVAMGFLLSTMLGCGIVSQEPAVDTQATVDAAVAATGQAQADAAAAEQNTQATVDAAVAATTEVQNA
ncbi:MAG: hypothetical protein JXA42_08490, partial [Anaerolineales bacterium]|nr:hypothetical protein [Anaerolineales bacterium]